MFTDIYGPIRVFSYLLAIIVLSNCTLKNKPNEISDEVVLKIGNFEITRYEFENKTAFLKNEMKKYNTKQKQKWIDELIDRYYVTADAYNKKYDTCKMIKIKDDYISLYMASTVGEYYWNKVVAPTLKVSNAEIKAVYKKMDKLFYIDYIVFANRETLIAKLKDDTIIKSEKEFNKLASECKNLKNIWYANHALVYPFEHLDYFKDIIYNLKPGEITKPLYSADWIFIFHLNKIETLRPKPFKDEKANIENRLMQYKVGQIVQDKQKEIFAKARFQNNENVAGEIFNYLKNSGVSNVPPPNGNKILSSYLLNNKRANITVPDFLDYYHNFPFGTEAVMEIKDIFSITNMFILRKIMFAEADSLGVTREKTFLLEKTSYRNDFILDEYFKNEIVKNISVTEKDEKVYYEKNKSLFEQGKVCTAMLLFFKDRKSLLNSWNYLASKFATGDFQNLRDTNKVEGLMSYLPDAKIEKDSKDYPQELIFAIFNSEPNQISQPYLECGDKFVVFYKVKEEEKRLQSFEEVKTNIHNTLLAEKIGQARKMRLQELKKKYRIVIDKTKSFI